MINIDFTETEKFIDNTTYKTGETLQSIANFPYVKQVSKFLKQDWFLTLLGEVNTQKIQDYVDKLKNQYPLETPRQIANRIILDRCWKAGGIGLFTNFLPPLAILLLGLEMAAMTQLQSEMVFYIAAAYNLDLHNPSRRGEVLAIFGLAFGGGIAKTGLNVVEIIPGIGPIVGASTDALILAILGLTACQYYEGKYQK
ncbi:hypothetical protein [Gloeothece verrucosa]|uniref:DUF697 domain-containing protein n=1 Tax=Gloeothece verrucosa (strain PCC 7822) TaxID=497965 RepID=E0UJU4_GLOV7|nr:hypothetical protein [Gloeothece verrucosa]ADN13455.1 conserved hypothetical protein [Gloeothece verrucosa PCC 7822]